MSDQSNVCMTCDIVWVPKEAYSAALAQIETLTREKVQLRAQNVEDGKRITILRAELDAAKVGREPTQKMLEAARDWSANKFGKAIGDDSAIGCWQVMYDAARARPGAAAECNWPDCGFDTNQVMDPAHCCKTKRPGTCKHDVNVEINACEKCDGMAAEETR